MPITLLDFILIGVMLISALLAMIRGFMREILSIAAWVIAAIATLYAYSRLLPYANAMPNNSDFGTYWNIMWKTLEASWTGAKAVDAAVNDAENELKSTLGDKIVIR